MSAARRSEKGIRGGLHAFGRPEEGHPDTVFRDPPVQRFKAILGRLANLRIALGGPPRDLDFGKLGNQIHESLIANLGQGFQNSQL